MRIAFTDGEMSNLQADFGQLLCACIVECRALTPSEVKAGMKPWTGLRTFQLQDDKGKRRDDKGLAVLARRPSESTTSSLPGTGSSSTSRTRTGGSGRLSR